MEFMQFHPTGSYVAGSARYIVSEAVRGEGAYLRDVTGDPRHMKDDRGRGTGPARRVAGPSSLAERTQHPNVYPTCRT